MAPAAVNARLEPADQLASHFQKRTRRCFFQLDLVINGSFIAAKEREASYDHFFLDEKTEPVSD